MGSSTKQMLLTQNNYSGLYNQCLQRLKSIEVRKELTDEWEKRSVQKGQEFAILTDDITEAWSGFTTREYKKFKYKNS
jgi:hypothetical protein